MYPSTTQRDEPDPPSGIYSDPPITQPYETAHMKSSTRPWYKEDEAQIIPLLIRVADGVSSQQFGEPSSPLNRAIVSHKLDLLISTLPIKLLRIALPMHLRDTTTIARHSISN